MTMERYALQTALPSQWGPRWVTLADEEYADLPAALRAAVFYAGSDRMEVTVRDFQVNDWVGRAVPADDGSLVQLNAAYFTAEEMARLLAGLRPVTTEDFGFRCMSPADQD